VTSKSGQRRRLTESITAARRMFADQVNRHQDRLREYEEDWVRVESRHNGPPPVTHPEFGSYATLKCGIDHERQRIAWLQWLGQQLATPQATDHGEPAR
jgi:Virulence activator alpha C-term